MAEPHVLAALKTKRARSAGEMVQAQQIIARRKEELSVLDAVIKMFSPDTDPDMIAPIRPSNHGLFFQYRELTRLCMDILRRAEAPMMLEAIVTQIMAEKGLPNDRRLRKHVADTARAGLVRLVRNGAARLIVKEPDMWWELVG